MASRTAGCGTLADAQAASTEAASLRRRLAAESDSARKQIAELEGKARAAATEREALFEKVSRPAAAWCCAQSTTMTQAPLPMEAYIFTSGWVVQYIAQD